MISMDLLRTRITLGKTSIRVTGKDKTTKLMGIVCQLEKEAIEAPNKISEEEWCLISK